MFHAYALHAKGGEFKPFAFDPGVLGADEVEVRVLSCGICHSDLSMADNEWGMTRYPFVGGHEVVGTVEAVGPSVRGHRVGDVVGIGWFSGSCMHCDPCLSGHHNLCAAAQGVIVGRHGGFADRVRCSAAWATKLPAGIDVADAGPLFCGGVTVFSPIVQHRVMPTARVGVIGVGGLGHLAIMFLNKWGCEVTAFSTTPDKEPEARSLGAHRFVATKDPKALQAEASRHDFILNTTNARLDWDAYANALAPRGVLHTVGAVLGGFGVSSAFPLILAQRSLSGSPVGSPATVRTMLDFCARHRIKPVTERFPISRINEAFERLRRGSPRYRLVLDVAS
jgi:uncharacterized zinc-type alcohol dehydrogenase-like protein